MRPREFSYSEQFPNLASGLPFIPITLINGISSATVSALVDSGSTVNVLPYDIGIQLSLVWEDQRFPLPNLVGILRNSLTFGVLLKGHIDPFAPVTLAFAWTKSNDVPVILGQTNFFSTFDTLKACQSLSNAFVSEDVFYGHLLDERLRVHLEMLKIHDFLSISRLIAIDR